MCKAIDHVWEEIHSTRSWGAYPTEHVIRFVARNYYNVEDRSKVRILDWGCGQGAHIWYLAREGFDTYAFDGSESAIEKTCIRLESEGLKASFKVADAVKPGYPNDYFDAIIDNVCIYCNRINDIKRMYSEAFRMLKPGGRLFSVCFGEDLDGYGTEEEIEPGTYVDIKEGPLKDRGLSHIYNLNEITGVIKDAGFINVECEWIKYTDKGFLVHHYCCTGEKKGL